LQLLELPFYYLPDVICKLGCGEVRFHTIAERATRRAIRIVITRSVVNAVDSMRGSLAAISTRSSYQPDESIKRERKVDAFIISTASVLYIATFGSARPA
jgi:hypothetical protein